MKIELERFQNFQNKIQEIRDVSNKCINIIKKNMHNGIFRITSEQSLNEVLDARK